MGHRSGLALTPFGTGTLSSQDAASCIVGARIAPVVWYASAVTVRAGPRVDRLSLAVCSDERGPSCS